MFEKASAYELMGHLYLENMAVEINGYFTFYFWATSKGLEFYAHRGQDPFISSIYFVLASADISNMAWVVLTVENGKDEYIVKRMGCSTWQQQ